MKAKEAAALLGVHVSTVRKYYRELGGVKLGRVYCFSAERLFVGVRPTSAPAPPPSGKPAPDPHGLLA